MPTSEDSKEREVLREKESKQQVRHKALARAHSQTPATSKHRVTQRPTKGHLHCNTENRDWHTCQREKKIGK